MDWNAIDLAELHKLYKQVDLDFLAPLPANPVSAPELTALALKLRPFVDRLYDWSKGHSFPTTPVFLAEDIWFRKQWLIYHDKPITKIGGWFESYPNDTTNTRRRIVIAAPWEGSVLQKSILLHESVHAMQHATGRLRYSDIFQNEFEAYSVQMAWLATQGFDVRSEGKFFSEQNLSIQTFSSSLYNNNYAWLEPWEKEYKP